jgi:hypothetical protein
VLKDFTLKKIEDNTRMYPMSTDLIYPTHIQKYAGVIKQNLDKSYYTFSYQNKDQSIQVKKRFPYYDLTSHDVACETALEFKRQFSIEHGLVMNPYRRLEDETIEVQTNVPGKCLLIDAKDLSLIEAFDWRIQNGYKYATCYLNDADYKKFQEYVAEASQGDLGQVPYLYTRLLQILEAKDESSIVAFAEKKRHYIPFHTMKYGLTRVDFINGNQLDNRDINIGTLTERQHRWKAHALTAKANRSNTSGRTGVFHGKCGNYEYWEVRGRDFEGNKICKKFSVTKHGYEGAKWMASHFRDLVIDQSYKPHQMEEIYQKVIHDFEAKERDLDLEALASTTTTTFDPSVPIRFLFDEVVEDEDFIYSLPTLQVPQENQS